MSTWQESSSSFTIDVHGFLSAFRFGFFRCLGTSSVRSVEGHKFYVLFVDDFSKFCWIYPIINKSDVVAQFFAFKSLVENLFATKIKAF